MSELDFAEIEKAMAELVSKAQGKKRQQDLGEVAKERSAIAKDIETAHNQGDLATKRIIVASNSMRSNAHPKPSAPIMPANPGRVMDFVPPAPAVSPVPALNPQPEKAEDIEDPELQKTVGELSNEYLTEQVREPEQQIASTLGEDPESGQEDNAPLDLSKESSEEIIEDIEEELPTLKPEDNYRADLENLTGPSPVMSSLQGQEQQFIDSDQPDFQSAEDLVEADRLSEDIGKVHKIYGQKLPKEYLQKKPISRSFTDSGSSTRSSKPIKPSKAKNQKPKKSRGFAFYFILMMVIAAMSVWGAAIYLYLIY